jgi:AraC-like DNA-binding protein
MEFMYVHQGKGHVNLDGRIHEVSACTILCFHPFQLHRLMMEQESPFVRTLILFEPSLLDPYFRSLPQFRSFFQQLWKSGSISRVIGPLEEDPYISQLLHRFARKCSETRPEHLLESFVLFIISLLQWLECYTEQAPSKPQLASKPQFVPESRTAHHAGKIMEWIEEHFRESFNLEELAKALHLSSCHVSHVFQQATGSSISSYLTNRRIREACLLLKSTSLPLTDIGNRVGIPNVPHLCTVFKKMMNVTPLQYRKMFNA